MNSFFPYKKQFIQAILFSGLFIAPSYAEQCDINLNYGVVIDPDHVRIIDKDKTTLQINGNDQLFVNGKEVNLTNKQKELVTRYTMGIREQIPSIVSIAIEGVDIGFKAVNKVVSGITGENSASHQKLQKHFDELQWRLRKRFNHSDQSFYIAPQGFDDFEQIFINEFEQEIEAIITDSLGTILVAVGEAINNKDSQNSEQRAKPFDERMASIGEELELEVGGKIDALKSKAEMFCTKLAELDDIEDQLNQEVKELRQYNLIQRH